MNCGKCDSSNMVAVKIVIEGELFTIWDCLTCRINRTGQTSLFDFDSHQSTLKEWY